MKDMQIFDLWLKAKDKNRAELSWKQYRMLVADFENERKQRSKMYTAAETVLAEQTSPKGSLRKSPDMYFVPCRKCGFQTHVVLDEEPTPETTTVCAHCISLENF